jgi:hypothetical protein
MLGAAARSRRGGCSVAQTASVRVHVLSSTKSVSGNRRRHPPEPGLREHLRDGSGRPEAVCAPLRVRHPSAQSVVCLPGLGRTAADFRSVATALAADPASPRLVLALDYRGHGQSQHDRNHNNYKIRVALADLSAVLTALGRNCKSVSRGSHAKGLRRRACADLRRSCQGIPTR